MKKALSSFAKPTATSDLRKIDDDSLARLKAAATQSDQSINLSDPDAPESLDWSNATRGRFYKPVKVLKSLRIDADVLDYYESQGPGYQTRINRDLRLMMLQNSKRKQPA
ncbi:BrnA antitoxin family protein [Acidisoma cladoniae]|uniref:BrnA antitoxin family protein n=1 Tax=Acidisoma cladoniae TaxID=3040935 RepID=UPI002549E11F|nr:BrnA antitoxin family protein [Acidisoma sp. PAMC 29798]